MNNINIINIFSNSISTQPAVSSIEKMNIIDILQSNVHQNLTDDYIIDKIKINNDIEIDKVEKLYNVKYNECLSKINDAIDLNLTDVFFIIPKTYFGYKLYNCKKCLEIIQNKLRNKNFETLIYTDNTIFISWKTVIKNN